MAARTLPLELVRIARALGLRVGRLGFAPPVAFVYNPLAYAFRQHVQYLGRAAAHRPRVVLLGMNPGPFGMAQTGVPFADAPTARGWLGITGKVGRPGAEHPKRPVLGLDCPRSEVSGGRLWGWAAERFGSPEHFFRQFLVANYCPLVFVEASGRNRTPDKLPRAERDPLEAACDEALRDSVLRLEPEWVVGVGAYARRRAEQALAGIDLRIGSIPHPSPANPRANRGWAAQAEAALGTMGIRLDDALPRAAKGAARA